MITLDSSVGSTIVHDNSRYIYFAGNNYLGLANHPDFIKAAAEALQKYGINFSASRQTTGTSAIHLEVEKLLAAFKDQDDAVVYATGYLGNKLLLDALNDRYIAVFADSQAHPSIREGIPRDVRAVFFYDHCNPDHLEDLLRKNRKYKPVIITDGVFALTGEIAPLDRIYPLALKYDALLVTDDAHATGILGQNGKGTPEYFDLHDPGRIFQSETMSKALGAYGGFVAARRDVIDLIRGRSGFYRASTSLPPSIAAAGCAALKHILSHPELRIKVLENARMTRNAIAGLGFETSQSITPIIPVFFKEQRQAKSLSSFLKQHRIIAPAVDYPVNLGHSLVRITVAASHTREQIENLLDVLKEWKGSRANTG